jgi:ABC-type transport system involved in multi-copper enzyme maturation permease subunit
MDSRRHFNTTAKEQTASGKLIKSRTMHPFWVIVSKEVSDHVRSWRFIILIGLIALTCMGSIYTALTQFGKAVKPSNADDVFFFLNLFTLTDGTLPSFTIFISFLGPLLGISMGFDTINSEHNRGTLSRLLSQPIFRDYIINAKLVAALIVVSVLFFMLGFLVLGFGLITLGIPPTSEELIRIFFFIIISIAYVAMWLNLSIFFSVKFRQAATSALAQYVCFGKSGCCLSEFCIETHAFQPIAFVQRVNYHTINANGQEPWAFNDGTDTGSNTQSTACWTKPADGLATGNRFDCGNNRPLCFRLFVVYEKRNPFKITIPQPGLV